MFYVDEIDTQEYTLDNLISSYAEKSIELEESWQALTERYYKFTVLYESKYHKGYYQEAVKIYNEDVKDVMRKLADWGRIFIDNIRKLIQSMMDWFDEHIGLATRLEKQLDSIDKNSTESRERSYYFTENWINICLQKSDDAITFSKTMASSNDPADAEKIFNRINERDNKITEGNAEKKYNVPLTKAICEKCINELRKQRQVKQNLQQMRRDLENESREYIRIANDEKNYKQASSLKQKLNKKVKFINKTIKEIAQCGKHLSNYVNQFIRECNAATKSAERQERNNEREPLKFEIKQ